MDEIMKLMFTEEQAAAFIAGGMLLGLCLGGIVEFLAEKAFAPVKRWREKNDSNNK